MNKSKQTLRLPIRATVMGAILTVFYLGVYYSFCQSSRLSDYPSNTVRNIVQVPGVGVRRGAVGERDAAVLDVGFSLNDEDCNAQSRIHGRGRSKEEFLYRVDGVDVAQETEIN